MFELIDAVDSLPCYITVLARRVKWARIQVESSGEVRMVVPHRCSATEVLLLYKRKQRWIEDKRAKALARHIERPLLGDDEVMLFGCNFRLVDDTRQTRGVRVDHDARVIFYGNNLLDETEQSKWLRGFAKEYLSARLRQLATQHGFVFNRVFIRQQRTRWGSCSSRGNISLNWKLIKAPVSVSDYVLLHELVHTEIMNHSAAFWQCVASLAPEYQQQKDWLRTNGWYL